LNAFDAPRAAKNTAIVIDGALEADRLAHHDKRTIGSLTANHDVKSAP
jgi:hypothetical protein